MNLKALYQKFRLWQMDPFVRKKNQPLKTHQCASCGHTYDGVFCPVCGQRYSIGKVNWRTIWDDIVSIIGLDKPHSFIAFFVQLFGRPGYMIRDYISGRQKVYSPPLGMLGIMAGVAAVVGTRSGDTGSNWIMALAAEGGVVGSILTWISNHLDWTILIQTALLLFPTWLLFRHSPKLNRHTWPQGIYIQIFMGCMVLICIILREVVGDWVLTLVPIFYYIAYKQLFGYGVWSTIWRTLLALGSVIYTFGVIMMGISCLSGKYETNLSPAALVGIVFGLLVLGAAVMFLGCWIDRKRREGKNNREPMQDSAL